MLTEQLRHRSTHAYVLRVRVASGLGLLVHAKNNLQRHGAYAEDAKQHLSTLTLAKHNLEIACDLATLVSAECAWRSLPNTVQLHYASCRERLAMTMLEPCASCIIQWILLHCLRVSVHVQRAEMMDDVGCVVYLQHILSVRRREVIDESFQVAHLLSGKARVCASTASMSRCSCAECPRCLIVKINFTTTARRAKAW